MQRRVWKAGTYGVSFDCTNVDGGRKKLDDDVDRECEPLDTIFYPLELWSDDYHKEEERSSKSAMTTATIKFSSSSSLLQVLMMTAAAFAFAVFL